ncbi:acetylornithine deacetylase [Aeromonas cavernicola]|uniref:Acetylornithine deacetylase n=1 Tax=Aeromonas cavernicola TaxID=1006623 RepID=A0A2H9U6R8_9GAMM|nr:acetylornithine deacetylase [Aeromonas cavernicola]PJG59688.1 acetylornithine deacetylase [Aeromonas cavernicola]
MPDQLGNTVTPSTATLDWVKKLIEIDTTSRESNLGLIEMVRDALQAQGVTSHLTFNAERNKANLFATLPAADGRTQGGIVLSGHTDVVPVDGQQWSSDPFKPVVRNERLYGRGTCDMKGFIGTALALLPHTLAQTLQQPIHLAFSYDEEVGCLGAPHMLADLQRRGLQPAACVVGEPTSMQVVVAHKGVNAFRCHVHGHAAHSSLTPTGLNAIEYAAKLICFIRELANEMRAQGPFDQAFDVPFTTAQVSQIRGGVAINTVPDYCTFDFEYRNLPTVQAQSIYARIHAYAHQELLPLMKAEHESAHIMLETLAQAPSLEASEQAAITQLARALTRHHDIRKVAYATEAGQFQALGIPTIVCGPGDIMQAHRPDEFVSLEQLARCEQFLKQLIQSQTIG